MKRKCSLKQSYLFLALQYWREERGGGGVGTSFCLAIALPQGFSYFNPISRVILQLAKKPMLLITVLCFGVVRTDSPLAKLYTTSTLEHHHFNHAVIILSTEVSDSLAMHVLHYKYSEQSNLAKSSPVLELSLPHPV